MYDAPADTTPIVESPNKPAPAAALPVSVRLKLAAPQERALRRWLTAYKRPGGYGLERDSHVGRGCYRLSLRTPQEAVDVIEVWQLQLWA